MKSRRGLSTVVGAVFFVIAATTVITYISYSMNSIDEFAQSVIVSEAENINRGMEGITIPQATIVGGEFNMTVVNTGSLPVKLIRLWVVNEDTGINSKADLDETINSGNQKYNIGQGAGIAADSTSSYTLKAVTSRGNIATFSVSPNTSTQVQLITPAEVAPSQEFRVVSIITNNSTLSNNIANLVPIIANNASLTQVQATTPSSIAVLPQGNSVTFSSSWIAPSEVGTVEFMANYTGAPSGAGNNSTVSIKLTEAAEEASNSQWSQAASRVGILISGIPNPVETSSTAGEGRWGVGIINPLDREVEIYALSIHTPGATSTILSTPIDGIEPADANWDFKSANDIVVWQSGGSPVTIPGESVAQFRVTTDFNNISAAQEVLAMIQVLSSEGKLNAIYGISAKSSFQTMNMFYTSNPSSPVGSDDDWGYLVEDIPSGKSNQIFNATVENASSDDLESSVKLIILIPADFDNVSTGTALDVANALEGWGTPVINENPDGSTVITVTSTTGCVTSCIFEPGTSVFQYKVDVPTVTSTKLYVFQTTSIYPEWTITDALQVASALSEAGVQVVP